MGSLSINRLDKEGDSKSYSLFVRLIALRTLQLLVKSSGQDAPPTSWLIVLIGW